VELNINSFDNKSDVELDLYSLYLYALRSPSSRDKYQKRLEKYFDFLGLEGLSIEEKSKNFVKKLEKDGSQWVFNSVLKFMQLQLQRVNRKEIAGATARNFLKSIKLYIDLADIPIAWKKISRGLPKGKSYADDRIPTIDELQKLLDYPDRRIKSIVYTMASSGIRLGAWDFLKWGHVRPIIRDNEIIAAKIIVYAGEDEEYFSYISKESFISLQEWMQYRENSGELIDENSWLMRDLWDTRVAQGRGFVTKPKKLASTGVKRLVERAIWAQGLRKKLENGKKRHPFSALHSLRKWFKTRCEVGGMKPINVEILLSHSVGISSSYYRPTETELLEDYLKVSNLLVIGKAAKLERELKTSEQQIKEKLLERDEQIRSIREEAQSKDDVLNKVLKKVEALENDLNKEKKWRNSFWASWGN
jgi:hypothetical protein